MSSPEQSKVSSRIQIAKEKHERLLLEGALSKSSEIGKVAIICSTHTYVADESNPDLQYDAFTKEADVLANLYTRLDRVAEKVITESVSDVFEVIRDEDFSDIVLIGNGSFSNAWFSDQFLTWWSLSRVTNHLKTGIWDQRTCGHFQPGKKSIALGAFAVSDQRNIIAAVGHVIDDNYPDESLFSRPYTKHINSVEELQNPVQQIKIKCRA